jgi:hypothetical protein
MMDLLALLSALLAVAQYNPSDRRHKPAVYKELPPPPPEVVVVSSQ